MIKKAFMNEIIKRMAKKQNAKKKLNAGQMRECVRIFLESLIEKSQEGEITEIDIHKLAKVTK